MSEVFVSYSRKDLAFVEQLRTLLENADLGVWVDIEGLYAGEEFWPEVAKAIDAALVVVVVITPDSIASRFCDQELDWAIEGQKRIVPLCQHDVDASKLHPELAKRQWVFFRDSDDPEQALTSLLSAVRCCYAAATCVGPRTGSHKAAGKRTVRHLYMANTFGQVAAPRNSVGCA